VVTLTGATIKLDAGWELDANGFSGTTMRGAASVTIFIPRTGVSHVEQNA